MEKQEAKKLLECQIEVTQQKVIIAKNYIINNFLPDTFESIKSLLEAEGANLSGKFEINAETNPEESIKQIANHLSWSLAGSEAIWKLISSGIIFPATEKLESFLIEPVMYRSSRGSGGIKLNNIALCIPTKIALPPSKEKNQTLSDPDLYIHSIEIPNIDKEVEESLREAVQCFKHELYLACLTMLSRASEGAWIELGLKLCTIAPDETPKIKEKLEDPFVSIAKKIIETVEFYKRKDIFESLHKTSEIKPQVLSNVVVWADAVRESRNSVHYGVKPSLPNSYEKIAALLIGAVPHLRVLYKIRAAAK